MSEVGDVGKDPTVAAGVTSVLMSLDDSTLNVLLREEETLEVMVIDALQTVSNRRGGLQFDDALFAVTRRSLSSGRIRR